MATCARCHHPMPLTGHDYDYHPTCKPVQPAAEICSRCGETYRGLTSSGECGWCVNRDHPWLLSNLRRYGKPTAK